MYKATESPYRKIPLTQGKVTLIDESDYAAVAALKWCAAKTTGMKGYCAMSNVKEKGKKKSIRLHRFLMGFPKGKVVDHINHDTLDNRRSNLRVCTPQQNRFNSKKQANNTSGFKGITWHTYQNGRYGYWRVRFRKDGRSISVGLFKDKKQAIIAYNKAAKLHLGEYAYLNEV